MMQEPEGGRLRSKTSYQFVTEFFQGSVGQLKRKVRPIWELEKNGDRGMWFLPALKWTGLINIRSYAEVRPPGYLCFFKDQSSSRQNGVEKDPFYAPLDLRLVINFETPVKSGENVQLNLDVEKEKIKLK